MKKKDEKLVTLQKTHLTVVILVTTLSILAGIYTTYSKVMSSISHEAVASIIADQELRQERSFVKKEEVKDLSEKLIKLDDKVNQITDDVSWMRGHMEGAKKKEP